MKCIAYWFLVAVSFLSYSCNKTEMIQNITILPNDTIDSEISTPDNKLYKLYFRGGTETYNTKATGVTALQQNRYVDIYCYSSKNTYNSYSSYSSIRTGVLSPISSQQMEVKAGTYNFYAVGIANNQNKPPVFSYTSTGMLYNNIYNGYDYIYCQLKSQSISVTENITLVFSHMCAQIDISVITASENIVIDSLSNGLITPPTTTNSTMSLFNGVIYPSRSVTGYSPLKLNINGTTLSQILLPLIYYGNLSINFTAYTNGNKTGKVYYASIPLVNNSLQAGYSYSYELVLGESTLTFNNANVQVWVEVDENGNPKVPIKIK